MSFKPPYRLQVFLPDEVRDMVRDIAHEERTSMQGLLVRWIVDKIQGYPRYKRVIDALPTVQDGVRRTG